MKRSVREATKLFPNPIIKIMMNSKRKASYLMMFFLSLATEPAAQSPSKDTIGIGISIYEKRRTETINWLQLTMDGAVKKAKAERKDILVYFTAKWCGPCRKMDEEVFSKEDMIRVVKDNYIAIKIDIDSWSAKKWKAEFRINGVPDFYILNSDKKRLRHYWGGMELNQALDFLNLREPPADINMLDTTLNSPRKLRWVNKVELGIGAGSSSLRDKQDNNIMGYEIRFGFRTAKGRLSLSPSLSFASIGSANSRLNYFKVPAEIGLDFYRGKIGWLPGGYRILVAPYYGRLLNTTSVASNNKNDFGFDYGIGVYVGGANSASLELALKGTKGFSDILPQSIGQQSTQFFRLSATFGVNLR